MKISFKRLFVYFSIFVSGLLFFSCSTTKNLKPNLAPVYVTNTKKINLLSPDCAATEIDSVYSLTMQFGDDAFSVIAYAELNETGITMTLLNDFGTDMGTMIFDGESVLFDSPLLPPSLKAEYVIADIQNIYYDVEKLTQNYKAVKLDFEEVEENSKKYRRVKDGNKVIENIVFDGSTVKLTNLLRGYEYTLVEAQ